MRAVFQFPASMTSVVDAPRAVSSDASLPSHGGLILRLGLQEERVGLAVLFFRGVRRLRDRTPGGDGIGDVASRRRDWAQPRVCGGAGL